MQSIEEKEYWEVFHKDDRNQRARGQNGKRHNRKEEARRNKRMVLREQQAQLSRKSSELSVEEEEEVKPKKYGNGKIRKEQKRQKHYF